MSPFVKKLSPLEQRKRDIERELVAVRGGIRTLSHRIRRSGNPVPKAPTPLEADRKWVPPPGLEDEPQVEHAQSASVRSEYPQAARQSGAPKPVLRDARFVDYLSGSLETSGSLRHERHAQRNKAIVMLVIVIAVLLWIVFTFFSG